MKMKTHRCMGVSHSGRLLLMTSTLPQTVEWIGLDGNQSRHFTCLGQSERHFCAENNCFLSCFPDVVEMLGHGLNWWLSTWWKDVAGLGSTGKLFAFALPMWSEGVDPGWSHSSLFPEECYIDRVHSPAGWVQLFFLYMTIGLLANTLMLPRSCQMLFHFFVSKTFGTAGRIPGEGSRTQRQKWHS